MGVYIYKSKYIDAIKIGHYCKNNAWSRIAHRGFYSCICPNEIKNKVSINDLELLHWYSSLSSKDEKKIHKELPKYIYYHNKKHYRVQTLINKTKYYNTLDEAIIGRNEIFLNDIIKYYGVHSDLYNYVKSLLINIKI
jgi:hypothetical protein